jgi:hypothetical protein
MLSTLPGHTAQQLKQTAGKTLSGCLVTVRSRGVWAAGIIQRKTGSRTVNSGNLGGFNPIETHLFGFAPAKRFVFNSNDLKKRVLAFPMRFRWLKIGDEPTQRMECSMSRLLMGLLACAVMMPLCEAAESDSVALKYRSYRTWSLKLPSEKWFPVKEGIRIPHAGGDLFAFEFSGASLKVDSNGDGNLDRTIKALVDPKTMVSTTRVILSGKDSSGKTFRYAARLRNDADGWEWAPGGAMVGSIPTTAGPVPVKLIDQNGNGKFNDIGLDAMIVGNTDHAMMLSSTIFVDDKLQQIRFEDDGQSFQLSPYQGDTSQIDMSTSFNSKAVLLSSVILSSDRQHSFDIGAIEGPVQVPAGKYNVVSGVVGLGQHRVKIKAGKMKPLTLKADRSRSFDWGGPVSSEFQFARVGNQVQFSPDAIWYFGKAGEQYTGWHPIGKSPEFKVVDAETQVVLEVAILPGSC